MFKFTSLLALAVSLTLVFTFPVEEEKKSGLKFAKWERNKNMNPMELGYFQGDIRQKTEAWKNGVLDESLRWPGGVIPYEIVGSFNQAELQMIQNAIDDYRAKTCITFRPKTDADSDYLSIMNQNTGCWSWVGRLGGRQELNLESPGCTGVLGIPIHEMLHAVGFYHEQSRWERDDYVVIMWDNIQDGMAYNFDKFDANTVNGFGVPYDYGSVMHYQATAFSSNGQPTIVPLQENVTLGQYNGFSDGDVQKVNNMYNC